MVQDAVILLQWVGIGITAVGLGATWVRNGRSTSEKYGQLEQKVTGIGEAVDDIKEEQEKTNKKLDDLNTCVSGQATHCANVSSALTVRVTRNETDIRDIKEKS